MRDAERLPIPHVRSDVDVSELIVIRSVSEAIH